MIDRDFEQVSEEHMKSMTKPEGPAQERMEKILDQLASEPASPRQRPVVPHVPATPAPSQPAGAEEILSRLVLYERRPRSRTQGLYEQDVDYLTRVLAQQTAAKDAALVAAERERDSLRAEYKNFHRSLCDRFGYTHDPVDWRRDLVSLEEHINAALKAGKE